jgi:hypothetical protein
MSIKDMSRHGRYQVSQCRSSLKRASLSTFSQWVTICCSQVGIEAASSGNSTNSVILETLGKTLCIDFSPRLK